MMTASEMGARVWRNNTGTAETKDGRFIRFGLCVGSADLIGIFNGRFIALEIKQPGKKPTPEQSNFIDMINKLGGIAGICTCAEDVKKLLT